jgi:hypothetical protein
LAADGSRAPKPYTQRRASTVFLRVPYRDWPAVKRGYKTEFRAGSGDCAVPQLWDVPTPTTVVAYSIHNGRHDCCLMVLEELWQEPLGAISPESLANEGFESLAEFRTYWMQREHRRFTPTRQVFVYHVRPFLAADIDVFAGRLFAHLYGEFLHAEDLYALMAAELVESVE